MNIICRKSTNSRLEEKFLDFHEENPHVYALFKKFTFQIIDSRYENYSSKSIFERIRWHTNIETGDHDFKLNNNYTAYYSRLFEKDFPVHEGFFRKRVVYGDLLRGVEDVVQK